jgi:hypothetical protein
VCAYEKEPDESIFTEPPVLCIEILSPEDRMSRVMDVVQDYLSMGAPTHWKRRGTSPMPRWDFVRLRARLRQAGQQVTLTLEEIFS